MRKLLTLLLPDNTVELSDDDCLVEGEEAGIFVNEHTLEVDLFRSGAHDAICATIIALSKNGAAQRRAEVWRENPASADMERLLQDIKGISKGRFAQNLAGRLTVEGCPGYIQKAITYIVSRCA